MSMASPPATVAEIYIEAPPERVWELVTDIVLMGDWSPEYDGGEWLDEASGAVVGARFMGRNSREGREWETVSTVIEAERGRSFAWEVGDPSSVAATWRFDLTPDGSGTRVNQHVQLGPRWVSGRDPEVVAARINMHQGNMETTLEGLKSAADGAR